MLPNIEYMIKKLQNEAEIKGHTLYNICYRNAGVGIQWFDKSKAKEWPLLTTALKEGLYVNRYYTTLRGAIRAEQKRISKLPLYLPRMRVMKDKFMVDDLEINNHVVVAAIQLKKYWYNNITIKPTPTQLVAALLWVPCAQTMVHMVLGGVKTNNVKSFLGKEKHTVQIEIVRNSHESSIWYRAQVEKVIKKSTKLPETVDDAIKAFQVIYS